MIKFKQNWLKTLGPYGAAAVLAALPLQATEKAAYLTLDGGVSLMEDMKIQAGIDGIKQKMDTGYRIGLAGGYNLNKWAAIELETGFIVHQRNHVLCTWSETSLRGFGRL